MKRWVPLVALLVISSLVLTACPAPTPQIVEVEKQVVVEKEVVQTVVVEKEVAVEKIVEVTPTPVPVPEEEPKVVLKWTGGTMYEAIEKNWVQPFEEKTGIEVEYLEGGLLPAMLKAMVDSGNVTVDLFGGDPWVGGKLAELGLVQKINWDWLEEDYPGLTAQIPERWRTGPIFGYGTPGHVGCRVLAYRTDAFDAAPTGWADFWDVENFPGPRALWWGGYGDPSIEMALFALGYTADDMAEITTEMLDEAYAKLDEIKPHIVKWTTAGAESADMLARGEIVMADTWDGRVMAVMDGVVPVDFIRNESRCAPGWLAIPANSPHTRNAHKLLGEMISAEGQARFQNDYAYGGINPYSEEFLSPERWAMLSTGFADLAVYPSEAFYNSSINPDDLFGLSWSQWLAETWPAFEAAAPGEWIPSEHIGD